MATQSQFIANRLNTQKSTSTRSLSMSLGTPADCFMQNKPNLLDAQMNINKVLTKGYENKRLCRRRGNKPNSKPIYAQTNPNQSQFQYQICKTNPIKPNLSLPKGDQTQFQTRKIIPLAARILRGQGSAAVSAGPGVLSGGPALCSGRGPGLFA